MKRARLSSELISRRRMLKTAMALTVGYRFCVSGFPARAATKSPVGYALCIGMGQVESSAYGTTAPLTGPKKDMEDMAEIARESFFDTISLFNTNARKANVHNHIVWAADQLRTGDTFLLTYSGHGATRTNTNPGSDFEASLKDQTWCLSDGHWVDDERGQLFMRFARGVKIVVINDCCHSATTTKFIVNADESTVKPIDPAVFEGLFRPGGDLEETGADFAAENKNVNEDMAKYDAAVKALQTAHQNDLPKFLQEFDKLADHPGKFKELPELLNTQMSTKAMPSLTLDGFDNKAVQVNTDEVDAKTGAFVYSMSACADTKKAKDGNPNSLFTRALKIARKSSQATSYRALFAITQQLLARNNLPQAFEFGFGQGGDFSNQAPFKVV